MELPEKCKVVYFSYRPPLTYPPCCRKIFDITIGSTTRRCLYLYRQIKPARTLVRAGRWFVVLAVSGEVYHRRPSHAKVYASLTSWRVFIYHI